MSQFTSQSVTEIPNTADNVYAFQVKGHIDDDVMEDLAEYMNDAFDRCDSVNMLFDLSGYEGADQMSIFDGDVLKSRVRSISKVDRYAVIGAPENAQKMIGMMDKIIPVDARTFKSEERAQAWVFVGASPKDVRLTDAFVR